MRLCVFSNGGKSRPTDTLSAAHASRNSFAGRFKSTKMQLVWQSAASYPMLLNASQREVAHAGVFGSLFFDVLRIPERRDAGGCSQRVDAAEVPGTGNRLECLGLADGVAETQAGHPVRLRERSGDEDAGVVPSPAAPPS